MELLSQKYPGIYFICEQCGAMFGNVQDNEIYEENSVYCPRCHWKNLIPYYKKYDGIVKEEKTNVQS